MDKLITSAEAAAIIGCVDSRVRQLLRAGTLQGERKGRDWLVDRASAVNYSKLLRRPGPKPRGRESR